MDPKLPSPKDCCCRALADFAIVPMGGIGLDELVFASFKERARHGGEQWWLSVSTCLACRQDWMIASDERIYDNYYLRRLPPASLTEITEFDWWPDEFLTFEKLMMLGKATGRYWRFVESRSPALIASAEDLRRERPEITIEEIANLLAIPNDQATDLLL